MSRTESWPETPIKCAWDGCQCTHQIRVCVAGWLDSDSGSTPCPICRPEVAQHLRRQGVDVSSSRRTLRVLPRPSRESAKGLGDGGW